MGDSEIFVGRVARFTRAVLMVSAMGVAGIAPAMAQDTAAQDTQNDSAQSAATGGEIIVTALKRGTRLQDTPLAISAVTGDSLERAGTTSFTELTSDTPSLRIVDNGRGFDATAAWRKGLLAMQERAHSIGAVLALHSEPGRTVVEIQLR